MKKVWLAVLCVGLLAPVYEVYACSSSVVSAPVSAPTSGPRLLQAGAEFGGAPHQSHRVMNEPIDRIARRAQAEGLQVTYISDTVIRLTDARNTWITVEGLPAGSDMEGGGRQPGGSSSIMINRIIRHNVFRQARPRVQPLSSVGGDTSSFYEDMPVVGRLNAGSADAIYNRWEVGEAEGSTFGINPAATWGEVAELTLSAPLHITSPKGGSTQFSVGLDAAYRYPFSGRWDGFSAGVHGYGLGTFGGDSGVMFGGGPFVAWDYQFHPDWILSLGCLFELTKPDEGESFVEIAPAVNMGHNLTDAVALNLYAIHYKNLDSDFLNDSYTDIGTEVSWIQGAWSLSSGVRISTGLTDAKALEAFLGTNWIF